MAAMRDGHGAEALPDWLSLEAAASILGLNELHVRLLERDGKLKLRSIRDGLEAETASVLSGLPDAKRSREVFARHAANPDDLVESAIASLSR